jgi:hypothetical protein
MPGARDLVQGEHYPVSKFQRKRENDRNEKHNVVGENYLILKIMRSFASLVNLLSFKSAL